MAQRTKVIATKTDGKKRTHSCRLPFDLQLCVHMHANTHKIKPVNVISKIQKEKKGVVTMVPRLPGSRATPAPR